MPYTFDLIFSGLCLFDFADPRYLGKAGVTVHLVNALSPTTACDGVTPLYEHVPKMTYWLRNQGATSAGPDVLHPLPDGREVAEVNLAEKVVNLTWTGDFGVERTLPTPHYPTLPSQNSLFAWVPSLKTLHSGGIQLQPAIYGDPGLSSPVIAQVRLDAGSLESYSLGRLKNGDPAVFPFHPALVSGYEQALADRVVLRLSGIADADAVELKIGTPESPSSSYQFRKTDPQPNGPSGQPTVQVSITNLPPQPNSSGGAGKVLNHFRWFYQLVDWWCSGQQLPAPVDPGIPAGGAGVFCPPSSYP